MQQRDGHISTCFNKDTRELLTVFCAYCVCATYIRYLVIYLFVLVICYCRSFILFIVRLLFVLLFNSFFINSFAFIICCSLFQRDKLNSDPELCSGISILLFQYTTSSIQVNEHHTSRLHRLCLSIGAKDLL